VDGATAVFTFTGTKVAVYGTIGHAAANDVIRASFAVDDGSTTTFTGTPRDTIQLFRPYYESPVLPDGEHWLTIVNLHAGPGFWMDYFVVTQGGAAGGGGGGGAGGESSTTTITTTVSSTGGTSLSDTTTHAVTGPTTEQIGTSSPVPTLGTSGSPTPSAGSDGSGGAAVDADKKELNVGAIVGGTVGGVAFLLLLALGALFLIMRRRRRSQASGLDLSDELASPVAHPPPEKPPPSYIASVSAQGSQQGAAGYHGSAGSSSQPPHSPLYPAEPRQYFVKS